MLVWNLQLNFIFICINYERKLLLFQDKLSEAEDNIRLAIQRKETVELHNAVLEYSLVNIQLILMQTQSSCLFSRPELKEKSELYNKLVSQLNTTMADKAE